MTADKTTAVQQARVAELQDENGWPRIFTYPVSGKTITDQFRRYVTRHDPDCIGKALYEFLTMVCGFIAEYGLVPPDGNFRIKWAEPAKLIEELANGGHAARQGSAQRVYADGQTDVEVLAAIDALADEHRDACTARCREREFDRDINVAITLLEPHHFVLVPPGWRLVAADGQPQPAQPPGSLAEHLVQMAAAHGLALIAPATVEPSGQVRLL
jgi:hypothetical protein